jgi:hypothetical protein
MQTILVRRKVDIPDFGTDLSMEELIRIVDSTGSHFFSQGASRFFRSRTYMGQSWAKVDGWVFITSEQFQDSMGRNAARKYTVRSFAIVDGYATINTLPNHNVGFQQFDTLRQAKREAVRLTSALEGK